MHACMLACLLACMYVITKYVYSSNGRTGFRIWNLKCAFFCVYWLLGTTIMTMAVSKKTLTYDRRLMRKKKRVFILLFSNGYEGAEAVNSKFKLTMFCLFFFKFPTNYQFILRISSDETLTTAPEICLCIPIVYQNSI